MQRAEAYPRRPRTAISSGASPALAIFMIALALRVAAAWNAGPGIAPGSEAALVDDVAWNLARGAGFTFDAASGTQPTASVPPLVPWLTSLLYRAVGHRVFAGVILQCVIGALVPLLLAALGRSLFGGAVGRWAGWVCAIDPVLVRVSGAPIAGATACATLLLALWLSTEWVRAPRGARALGTGLAWGLAGLSHPSSLLVPGLVGAWAWRPLGLTVGGAGRLRQLALLALGLVAAVGPWTIRNALALRAFVPLTTSAGQALLAANQPGAWEVPLGDAAAWERRDADDARRGSASRAAALGADPQRSNEAEADAWAGRRALAFMRARLADWPRLAVIRLGRFWRPEPEGLGDGVPRSRWRGLLPLWSIVTLPFALWGVVRCGRGGRRWFHAFPLLVIPVFVVVGLAYPGPQGRVPMEPVVALLIALGLEDAGRAWRRRARGLALVPRRREPASPDSR